MQAKGLARIGDLDQATALIEELVAQIEAGEERAHHAEVLRLKGWIQIKRGEPKAAEATLRKAIEVARGQQAKSWELRAATTLARLLADRGDRDEAVAILKPVHDWFTEGLQTKDYLEGSRLLDELTRVTS